LYDSICADFQVPRELIDGIKTRMEAKTMKFFRFQEQDDAGVREVFINLHGINTFRQPVDGASSAEVVMSDGERHELEPSAAAQLRDLLRDLLMGGGVYCTAGTYEPMPPCDSVFRAASEADALRQKLCDSMYARLDDGCVVMARRENDCASHSGSDAGQCRPANTEEPLLTTTRKWAWEPGE
jgi:hypothetical protein